MKQLIEHLKKVGVLRSRNIESALRAADRKEFIRPEFTTDAYEDTALPIGFGQTISQPYTVVFMLELLAVESGQRVVDVGSGSGWQTALLSHLVGPAGAVLAFEIVTKLCDFGEENLKKFPLLMERVHFYCGSAESLPDTGKFDRLICAAELNSVPPDWKNGLKNGGIIVYPKGNSIWKETKLADGDFEREEYQGFVFVPFVAR